VVFFVVIRVEIPHKSMHNVFVICPSRKFCENKGD